MRIPSACKTAAYYLGMLALLEGIPYISDRCATETLLAVRRSGDVTIQYVRETEPFLPAIYRKRLIVNGKEEASNVLSKKRVRAELVDVVGPQKLEDLFR